MGIRLEAATGLGLAAFSQGFWINSDLKFTQGSDATHWIPPGRILYVETDRSEESSEEGRAQAADRIEFNESVRRFED